ncbi:MAG: hypothetical protein ACE5Q6_17535 [Dehalococcoidia bacterium]
MPEPSEYTVGQRVRINEEDDPSIHVGKMAIIERIELPCHGEPICVLKVDRIAEPLSLPQSYLEPLSVYPSSLLANDLFLPWDMDDPTPRLRAYSEDKSLAGHVLESLLFYDRLVIPTVDFSIVVPLVHWLGVDLFRNILGSGALSFVRYAGTLGYLGNGHGISLFEIRPPEDKPDEWWVRAARCSPKEATILQIQNRLSGLNEGLIDILGKLVEICTVDTSLPEFVWKVEEETYRDILGSDVLKSHFSIRNTNLKQLTGIGPDQMRVFSYISKPSVAGDEIDTTLRLAMLNLELYLSEEAGARDMVTDQGFSLLMDAKLDRFSGGSVSQESFSRLIAIEGIPDLTAAITSGAVSLNRAWDFRNGSIGRQFREWFDQVGPASPAEFEQEYVKSMRDGGLWSSGSVKLLRFVVVQTIGIALTPVIGPASIIASMGLSAADSFLLEKIRLGFKPRYFIDDLRHHLFPGC